MKDFSNFFKKHWYWFVAGLVILAILIYIYKSGKKAGTKPHGIKVPDDVIGSELTDEEKQQLKALAENIHDDMDGLNWSGHNDTLYEQVANLSDTKLVALSNLFNHYYEVESGETFRQWLNSESFPDLTLSGLVQGIIDRLNAKGVA
jgi:hypothetical protein